MTRGLDKVSQQIAKRLNESARLKEEIASKNAGEIWAIAELIIDSYRGGGKLAKVAELTLIVPSDSTPRIQEAHITIGHIICEIVEEELAEGA